MSKDSYNKQTSKKKWLTLTAVGVALLLIPRRSSRKDVSSSDNKDSNDNSNNNDISNNELSNTEKLKDS